MTVPARNNVPGSTWLESDEGKLVRDDDKRNVPEAGMYLSWRGQILRTVRNIGDFFFFFVLKKIG